MTKEDIAKVTPYSITSTNNPVYRVKTDTVVGMRKKGIEKLIRVPLHRGMKLRLLGCKLDKVMSPFMWQDNEGVLLIDNNEMEYTTEGGEVGDQFKGDYVAEV